MEDSTGSAIEQQFTKLLHQNRKDLMFELRRLAHKERIVTQQHARFQTLLDTVVLQRLQSLDSYAECAEEDDEDDCSSGGADTAKKPATLLLTTATVTADQDTLPGGAPPAQPVPPPRPSVARPAEIEDEVQSLVEQRPVSHLLRGGFRALLEQAMTESSGRLLRLRHHQHPVRRPSNARPSGNDGPEETNSTSTPAQSRDVSTNGRAVDVQGPVRELLERMDQQQQEGVAFEMDEIMHHQVVTTIMASEFRNVLEQHMEDRLHRAGTGNGSQVQQYVRSRAQQRAHWPAHRRGNMASLDSSDVVSLKADVRQLTQTVSHLERLMKLSFDLHLDNQRVLRQEMASISSIVHGRQGDAAASQHTTPATGGTCVVCQSDPSDSTFYSCGHMCTCSRCAHDLHARPNPVCPICRAPVQDIIRVYHV